MVSRTAGGLRPASVLDSTFPHRARVPGRRGSEGLSWGMEGAPGLAPGRERRPAGPREASALLPWNAGVAREGGPQNPGPLGAPFALTLVAQCLDFSLS